MAFGNVTTREGLIELNKHLAGHSYIGGYEPSKADISVFDALGKLPTGNYDHVIRWYRHIASFDSSEKSIWAGTPLPQVGSAKLTVATSLKTDNNDGDNNDGDGDDDVDLFGSDDEDVEATRIREERVAAYALKKSKKPALIAKSSVLLDVKPWSDETDMTEMEKNVRSIQMDGLLWGASKLVPVGYGIKKLQIMCVIEDEKVSTDLLMEQIQEFEDFVQSVDIAAFNKI